MSISLFYENTYLFIKKLVASTTNYLKFLSISYHKIYLFNFCIYNNKLKIFEAEHSVERQISDPFFA